MMAGSCATTPVVPVTDHTPTQALATVCFVAPRHPMLAYDGCDERTSHPPLGRDPVTELGVNRT